MRLLASGIGAALAVAAGMVIASAQTAPANSGRPGVRREGCRGHGLVRHLHAPLHSASSSTGSGRGGAANAARTIPTAKGNMARRAGQSCRQPLLPRQKAHHSWAIVGSEGIILIEALYDYMVADEVAGGMRKLGLDMNKVKYAVMSHAHGDHDGGAAYLQDSIPACALCMAPRIGTRSTNRQTALAASRSATWSGRMARRSRSATPQSRSSRCRATRRGHSPTCSRSKTTASRFASRTSEARPSRSMEPPRTTTSTLRRRTKFAKAAADYRRDGPAVESYGVRQRLLQGAHGRLPETR